MRRPPSFPTFAALCCAASLSACFSPSEGPAAGSATDSSSGSTTDAGTAGETSQPTGSTTLDASSEGPTGTDPTSADDSTGPTSGAGTTTTEGAACEAPSDCNAGLFCVDGTCVGCDDTESPDEACAEADADNPWCSADGQCVACTEASHCPSDAPACVPDQGCVPCDEHEQCPESACHLGGPDAGSCFSVDDVVEVQVPGAFAELLGEVGPGQDRVFVLSAATYTFPDTGSVFPYEIDGAREVAFIGNGATVLEGNVGPNPSPFNSESDASQVYFSRLLWNGAAEGGNDGVSILGVGAGAEFWIDDSTARGAFLNSGGSAHFRRSNLVAANATPFGFNDAGLQGSGSLYLESSSIDADPLTAVRAGGLLDIRYSTIVADGDFLCGDDTTGVVRNSIVLTGGSISDECEGAMWSNNAVNTTGFGVSVPAYNPAWFNATEDLRFRLSGAGQAVFADIAEWEDGDPLQDAEGDERPTRGPSTAGADEPG